MYLRVSLSCFTCLVILLLIGLLNLGAEAQTDAFRYLEQEKSMTSWLILGPVPVSDNPNPDEDAQKKAFGFDFLADNGGESGISPSPGLSQKVNDKDYTWQVVESDSDIIDLLKIYGGKDYCLAYAWSEIEMAEAKNAFLGIGSDDGVKVWLNGKLVHEKWIGRSVSKDDDIVPVAFQKGKNQILLKVQNMQFGWGFACREVGNDLVGERLRLAVRTGDLDAIKSIATHGLADVVNSKNKIGLTALHLAQISKQQKAIDLLIANGADADIPMPAREAIIDMLYEESIQGDSPGSAVLAAMDGKILYQKGFGYADLENHIPITPETKFRIGSISKQFTAAAILKLQEEGKLSVSDLLSKFIPDFPRGDEVTIDQLLTHTSGIHGFTEDPEFYKVVSEKADPDEAIETIKGEGYDLSPGEKWFYSNSGYFILGYIVEKVSGMPLGNYLKSQFFEPLGMKNTGIHSWDIEIENDAVGYSYQKDRFEKAMRWDMSRAGGAGAIYSTVGDLLLWNEAIFNGKALDKASIDSAFTPAKLEDGTVADVFGVKGIGYGYGWMMSNLNGIREIAHSGGFDGFNAYLTRFPEYNLTIAVLTNCLPPPAPKIGTFGLISVSGAQAIASVYLWEQMNPTETYSTEVKKVDASLYDDYVGRYDYGISAGILEVTREGDKLYAQMSGQGKFEIFPSSDNEFFWKIADAKITFIKGKDGKVTHLIHNQGGMEINAPRLKDEEIAKIDPSILDSYVGEYDFGRAIMKITKEGDHLFAQMADQPKFEIFPRSDTEFFWKVVNAQVTFIKDDNGIVTRAIFQQGDIKFEVKKFN